MPRSRKKSTGKKTQICFVVEEKGYTAVREQVAGATHYCRSCGRVAQPAEALCSPVKI